jgi:hypothetical protein
LISVVGRDGHRLAGTYASHSADSLTFRVDVMPRNPRLPVRVHRRHLTAAWSDIGSLELRQDTFQTAGLIVGLLVDVGWMLRLMAPKHSVSRRVPVP